MALIPTLNVLTSNFQNKLVPHEAAYYYFQNTIHWQICRGYKELLLHGLIKNSLVALFHAMIYQCKITEALDSW